MKYVNAKSLKRMFPSLPILLIFVTFILIAFGSSILTSEKSPDFCQLSSGWSVNREGKVSENVTLSEYSLTHTKKGEVISISHTIPISKEINSAIMFKSNLSAVEVFIDGEQVYSYGIDLFNKGLFIPKRYNFIYINDPSVTHNLKISYTIANNNIHDLYPVYYGEKHELVRNFLEYHRLSIFIGAFFIIYACMLFSLGLFLFLYKREGMSLFFNSALSLLLGIYTYAYNDIFCFVSDKDYFFSIMEYVSLYLIPLSISILLFTTHPNTARIRQLIILVTNIILPVSFRLIHLFKISHIASFVIPIQLISIIEIIIILPPLLSDLYKKDKERRLSDTYTGINSDKYLLLGFIIMIAFAFAEIIKFNFTRFHESNESANMFMNISFLTLGMLYFIICLFIYYFLNGIEHMNDNNLKKHLEGLAYTDALTGLMNRAKSTQYIVSLDVPYALVSLDLDRLKYVNDTYGHIEGDKMIKAFADILRKSFEGASLIGRMGGDEFLVVYEKPDAYVCDKSIQMLKENMNEFNKENDIFTLSASAGYAYSYEVDDGNFESVFYLADSRMYEMKEKHHA